MKSHNQLFNLCILIYSHIHVLLGNEEDNLNNIIFQNGLEGITFSMVVDNFDQSFGFGFWSQCTPQLKSNINTKYYYDKKPQILPKTQFLFQVQNQQLNMLALLDFKEIQNFTQFNEEQELSFSFEPLKYEGKWLFNMIIFNQIEQQIMIQITDHFPQYFIFKSKQLDFNMSLGGVYIQQNFIIDFFKGRFSQLCIKNDVIVSQNLFQQFTENYSLPQEFNPNKFQYIISDVIQQYASHRLATQIVDQKGIWYAISGWIKHDCQSQPLLQQIEVIRISNSQQLLLENDGNLIFSLLYSINLLKKNLTSIITSTEFHYLPFMIEDLQYTKKFIKTLLQEQNENIYLAIQEWHFFSYEYKLNEGGKLQINFNYALDVYSETLGDYQYNQSFINSIFYIYIGENLKTSNVFIGQLAQIKFFHYNGMDDFANINNGCHSLCEKCYGPEKNNCLSCKSSQNRVLVQKIMECHCQVGYIQLLNGECKLYTDIYLSDIIENQLHQNQFCDFGYFYNPTSFEENKCLQCPYNNKEQFYCLECILNPNSWYQDLYCEFFLQQRESYSYQDDAFLRYQESIRHNFIIDQANQLISLPLFKNFCMQFKYCKYQDNLYLTDSIQNEVHTYQIDQFQQFINTLPETKCIQPKFGQYNNKEDCQNCQTAKESLRRDIQQCQGNFTLIQLQTYDHIECGSYCLDCKNAQCDSCVDESKYYISLDKRSCRKNEIPYCLQAFQALQSDYKYNSLLKGFQAFDQKEAVVLCARCEDNYVFVFSIKQCLKLVESNCLFAVAQSLDQQQENDKNSFAVYLDNTIAFTKQSQCLITYEYSDESFHFFLNCFQKLSNCISCLKSNDSWVCLQCQTGYNIENNNCLPNFEQSDYIEQSKSEYLNKIAAFSQYLMGNLNVAQIYSENIERKIICHSSCLECASEYINGLICLRCKANSKGRLLSLSYTLDQCIECPENCQLCQERTTEQILQINPLFQNQNFSQFTRLCLKDDQKENLFYDRQLGQFIECQNQKMCKKQLKIKLNLFCSQLEFNNQLQQLSDFSDREKFRNENILYQDLVNNQIPQYNQEFYQKANMETIRKISIIIYSERPQMCQSNELNPIVNKFSENIFSSLEVNLQLLFSDEMLFDLPDKLVFENFTTITLQGIKFQIRNQNTFFSISFASKFILSSINLTNISFQGNQFKIKQSIFTFINVQVLHIKNFNLTEINLFDGNLFTIKLINEKQQLNFSELLFQGIQFKNFSIIQYQQERNTSLILELIKVKDCNFTDSFISQFQISNQNYSNSAVLLKTIALTQLEILSSKILFTMGFQNQRIFFDFKNFSLVNMTRISVIQSEILNANLINMNNFSSIQNFQLNECILNHSQIIIYQSGKKVSSYLYFQNISFNSNNYNLMSSFIQIQSWFSTFNQLDIIQLNISNNSLIQDEKTLNKTYLNQSLIYLSSHKVYLEKLNIFKGVGFSEISLISIQNLTIWFMQIQGKIEQIFHEKDDCNVQINSNFNPVLNMYSITFISILNASINQTQQINSPLIYYRSAQIVNFNQSESIILRHIEIHKNLIFLEKKNSQIGILKLETFQNSQITIQNCNFNQNIMQEKKDDLERQALLINILAQLSSITLSDSLFQNNIILNSFDSILSIKSQNISIRNCSFLKNNILSYEILQPFIIWDFNEKEKVFQEDIFDIFQIKSLSGNGVLEFNRIVMDNITIQESRALTGAGFKLIPQNYSEIEISDIVLNSIETTFNNLFANCGVIMFDLSQSVSLVLTIQNVVAQSIFLYNQCSLIKIFNIFQFAMIKIINIEATDIFSQSASLVSISFDNDTKISNFVKIKNVKCQTTKTGWENYFNQVLNYNLLQTQITEVQFNYFLNRTTFLIEFGKSIKIENIQINSQQQESAFVFTNVQQMIMKDILIQNLVINEKLIFVSQFIDYYSSNFNFSILIQNLKIFNIRQEQLQAECKGYIWNKKHMQCNQQQKIAPQSLETLSINLYDYCTLNLQNFTYSNSIIQFISINQMYINNFELMQIFCESCFNGLFFIQFVQNPNQLKLQINNFFVFESQCGDLSCLYISKLNSSQIKINQSYQYWPEIQKKNQILIQNYLCKNNRGSNGTCLNINNLRVIIRNSIFLKNKANYAGGALYFSNNGNFIFIEKCYIAENYAIFGGGIFMSNQFEINYGKLYSLIQNNQAFQTGQNIYSTPIKLSFSYGEYEKNCQINRIYTENYVLDQVLVQQTKKIFGIETDYLLFPNGQKINKYQYFDWQNRKYIHPNLNFRIISLTAQDEKYFDLYNTSCIIRSGVANGNLDPNNMQDIIYTDNYTSFNLVYYNTETEDYNLDNLEIHILKDDDILSIEFQCESIQIPIYNKNYPYNLIESHQNYSLRFFIKPLSCQLGEIKNYLEGGCELCNFEEGFFVLELNSHNCLIRDDVSTSQVTSVQLLLRQGFWRPYFDTSIVSYCENLHSNCNGGWVEGDQSCLLGHIGALCEQCDLHNIRGDGKYYRTNSYSCSLCEKSSNNIYILILLSIYIFASIILSVTSNIESVEQQLKILKMKLLGFKVIFLYNENSILLKMLTNYFQIIGTIHNIQKKILIQNNNFLSFSISPIQSISVSIDCLLSNSFTIGIHYIRMIFELIQPFCFIIMSFTFYSLGSLCNQNKINQLLVSTNLIYIYIYFQPILVGKLVQLISFKQISGFKWILANVAFRYDNSAHYLWIEFFLLPALSIYVILIPLFFIYGLYINRLSLNNKIVRQKWGYLFGEFRNDSYQWEILRIFQKSILLGFLNYYEDFPTIQALIVIFILQVYIQFFQFFKPYTSSNLNNIDSSIANVCLISGCSILLINYNLGYQDIEYVQQLFFFALNIRVVSKIVLKIIAQYLKQILIKLKVKIDIIRDFLRNRFSILNKYPFIYKLIQNQGIKEQRRAVLYQKLKSFLIYQGKIQSDKQKQLNKQSTLAFTIQNQKISEVSNKYS